MRERLPDALAPVPRERFLVYLMGPYASVDPEDDAGLFDRLAAVRDHLRAESGVNAFLAVDLEIPLEEVDAPTQSIAFTQASNVVVFVLPFDGDNLGIGVEVGAVLEDVFQSTDETRADRVVLVHEAGVTSAMLDGVTRRWDATVYEYESEDELVFRVTEFAANVLNRELTGDLPRFD